ncbi:MULTISPECIES: DICT sensory domain-containing protein [Rhodococcus]|uniref:EAL domain-containing protein n=1 Tax=Rhodococcus oxybenzonivorans TaxID=1990687 RepID=A0AAE4UXL6_9NOCA|nr:MULTISPECIES: DICT sensory domain-containing protein [Rhodococcus]MDV7245878.1 EAL domain-containing protein [Rhodococcus oxybenzonivorans]MDV7264806.1 EAL domain-containing protein [Rhodococcus oxybenzonivorans]MDV7277318.1 EAL domain-containing protein [Rhodococcus oxybenzonivorans]MDV7336888.1 EAL domain-containing protein [Rhodococcus oxybenzonivorans]MDV7347030.1 EAL domain-containing protein [Rhodococcus oxybenzonivorans]
MFVLAPDQSVDNPDRSVDTAEVGGLAVSPHTAAVRRLDNGALAALEVQLRGPADGPLATPEALRTVARAMNEKRELDHLTWDVAGTVAADGVPVLVSIDLDSLPGLENRAADPECQRREIVVVTAAIFTADPSRALRAVADARGRGRLIAVDDVGTHPAAIALLSLIEPDIILLAPVMITRRPDSDIARTAHAVAARVESSGAVVVATGVGTEVQRRRALSLGATYGVGEHLEDIESAPASWPASATVEPFPPTPTWNTPDHDSRSPHAIASSGRTAVRSLKRLLVTMSTTLETHAAAAGPETLVLGTFQRAEHFTDRTRTRWQNMASRIAYAGVYGVGMGHTVDEGIHQAPLAADDELVEEWNVVVLGPHFGCVLSAVDLHRGEADSEREFDYVVSYDRSTVVRCARAVLDRFTADPSSAG